MKKSEIIKFIVLLIFILLLLGVLIVGELYGVPVCPTISGIMLGLLIPLFVNSFIELFFEKQNWKLSERRFRVAKAIKKEDSIRISFAYLYRIELDGKYLLVKNSRGTGKYQPVGGVYKYYDEEESYLKSNYHIEPDSNIQSDDTSKRDYRFKIKDKYLRKFVKHFIEEDKNRENEDNVSREFIEEVLNGYKSDLNDFGIFTYYFRNRFIDFAYSSIYECYELVLADIYEVKLNESQEKILRNIIKERKNNYVLASVEDIKNQGIRISKTQNEDIISNHSWKILPSSIGKSEYAFNGEEKAIDLTRK